MFGSAETVNKNLHHPNLINQTVPASPLSWTVAAVSVVVGGWCLLRRKT